MIETLINADEVQLQRDMAAGYKDMKFAINYPRLYRLWTLRFQIFSFLAFHLLCKRHGHTLVDNGSYAGPESGAEHLLCRRCGWAFDHIYY